MTMWKKFTAQIFWFSEFRDFVLDKDFSASSQERLTNKLSINLSIFNSFVANVVQKMICLLII
jgi:hypothetical protein